MLERGYESEGLHYQFRLTYIIDNQVELANLIKQQNEAIAELRKTVEQLTQIIKENELR